MIFLEIIIDIFTKTKKANSPTNDEATPTQETTKSSIEDTQTELTYKQKIQIFRDLFRNPKFGLDDSMFTDYYSRKSTPFDKLLENNLKGLKSGWRSS